MTRDRNAQQEPERGIDDPLIDDPFIDDENDVDEGGADAERDPRPTVPEDVALDIEGSIEGL